MSIDKEKLDQLQTLLNVVNNSITKKEFAVSFKAVYDFVKQIKAHNEADFRDMKMEIGQLSDSMQKDAKKELSELKDNLNAVLKDVISEMRVECDAKMQAVDMKMMEVRSGLDGLDGKDADEKKIVEDVLRQIPSPEDLEPLEIVELLESLKGDKRLDASAIKNLPTGKGGGGGAKALRWLTDITNAQSATDGLVLTANGDNTYTFEAPAAGVDTANSPNANEFARFTDADTIEGLTYAETRTALGLVIGTNVQAYSANLDEYAAVNPTAAGLALLDDADTAAQLVTLGFTSTIIELNYTDGVTSAIQTQLDAKIPSSYLDTDTSLTANSDVKVATQKAVKTYVDNVVVGLLDYRGSYDASSNLYPATGGSGLVGAVVKGDFWVVSVAGTLGGTAVTAGDLVIALADTPGQTAGNWDLVEHDLGYAPENSANKVTSISGASTDTQYPSAKLLYDQLALKQGLDTQLTDLAGLAYAGNALKYIRINAGENGFELASVSGGTGITRAITTTSGSATMGSTAATDYVYFVAGNHTMSLPAASGNTNRYTVKNLHSAAITVDTAGAENVEGAASLSLQPNDAIDLLSDDTNWYVA